MKKILIFVFVVTICFSVVSCGKPYQVVDEEDGSSNPGDRIEMTDKQLEKYKTQKGSFYYHGFLFVKLFDGTIILAQLDRNSGSAVEIRKYDPVDKATTVEDMEEIRPGMNLFEVMNIARIIPSSSTSGLSTLDFKLKTGETYQIIIYDIDGETVVTEGYWR